MERLPTVGDLVKFKQHCVPDSQCPTAGTVYLAREHWGTFVRLHGVVGLSARENFEIISEVPKEV